MTAPARPPITLPGQVPGHTEDAIAADWAAGLPAGTIVARHNLASERVLTRIIEKPRVDARIRAHQAAIQEAAARIYARKAIACDEIMDALLERAKNKKDPRQHQIGMWVIDSIAPVAHNINLGFQGSASPEMFGQFIEAVDRLCQMAARPAAAPPLVEAGDPHLHSGKEFIAQRDQEVTGIAADGK